MFVRTCVRRVRVFGAFECSEVCSESQSLDLKKNWPAPQVEDLSFKISIFQRRTMSFISAVFGCVRRIVFGEHVFDCVPVFVLCLCVRIVFFTSGVRKLFLGIEPICVRYETKKGVFEGHLSPKPYTLNPKL